MRKTIIYFFKRIFLTFCTIFFSIHTFADQVSDSLYQSIKTCKNDTDKVYLMCKLSYALTNINNDTAISWINKAYDLANKINNPLAISKALSIKGIIYEYQGKYDDALKLHLQCLKILIPLKDTVNIASSLNSIAIVYDYKGDYPKSLEYHFKSLNLSKQIKNKKRISASYLNIGLIYYYLGVFDKALKYTFNGLKLAEESSDQQSVSDFLNNLGLIYEKRSDYPKALEYFNRSLAIFEKAKDKSSIADSYNNLGLIYFRMEQYDSSLVYFNKSILIKNEIGNPIGVAQATGNMGLVYKARGEYKKALDAFNNSIEIQQKLGEQNGVLNNYINLGQLFFKTKEYKKSLEYFEKALELAKQIGSNELLIDTYQGLSNLYKETSDFEKAYKYQLLFQQLNDSLYNSDNNRKIIQLEFDYNFEKQQQQIESIRKQKEIALAAEFQRQKTFRNSLITGIGMLLLLTLAIFKSYRQKKKANKTLSLQKYQIEEQNEELKQQKEEIATQRDLVITQKEKIELIHHELTDSIHYAKRIQSAVLPTFNIFEKSGLEYFVIFKPRNIVSGDFYWATEVNNVLIFCVADCTGHGVPGAFMSMLGISLLNELVKKERITNAAQILHHLRQNIINSLQQHGVSGEQKDGMDIALCVLNTETLNMQFAGANNPVYIVRKSKVENYKAAENKELSDFINFQLDELKGDKMPIAIYERMDSFTNKEIQLNKGDIVYLFSDGYADQFGGSKGRKFMYKRFKENLLMNSQKTMKEQKEILDKTIKEWIGNGEQVDDITIVGIKI